ncbi:hypothetical protein CK498_05935 [Halomonas salipaludis]|uniref:Uncharacterized protein n=1 Tax=Halomonas salipaludis TaxID=2032625 RepID=A0A2A2F0V8_9GAMM|nr:hypothetical protein CK498_05935 [Halomonas salipaludis]
MPWVRSIAPNGLAMDGQHWPCKRSRMRECSRASVAPRDGLQRLLAGLSTDQSRAMLVTCDRAAMA